MIYFALKDFKIVGQEEKFLNLIRSLLNNKETPALLRNYLIRLLSFKTTLLSRKIFEV